METSQLKMHDYCFDLEYKHIDRINSYISAFYQNLGDYIVTFAIVNYIKNNGFAINDNFKEPTLEEFGFYIELFFDEVIKEDGDKLTYKIKDDKLIIKLEGKNYYTEWLECLCKCFNFKLEIANDIIFIFK